MDLPIK